LNLSKTDVGRSSGRYEALQGLESIYSPEMAASVSDQMTNFFNALHELSSHPEEAPVRGNVREASKDLVSSFNRVDANLERHMNDINQKIDSEAKDISAILSKVATLNSSIASMEVGSAAEANDLRDQRDVLVRQLSEKINIGYYTNEHGMLCIRGPGQSLLVDGKMAASMHATQNGETGQYDLVVIAQDGNMPRKISHDLQGGKLQSLYDVRDNVIMDLRRRNNEMAATLADHFNAVHREGYGLKDFGAMRGRDFFEYDASQAARSIKVTDLVMENTDAISAGATPNAPGDNIIINELLRLRSAKVMDGGRATFTEDYSNYVSLLGIEISRANNQLEADNVIFGDLSSKREAISGVSLDEEAVNLLKWQTAFAASSKVITTTDEMLETVLSLKR